MTGPLNTRTRGRPQGARSRPAWRLSADVALITGRAHEIAGQARRVMALLLAANGRGPVLWLRPAYPAEQLVPQGLAALGLDPGRLVFVTAHRPVDLLWSAEEALRSRAVPLVVAELPEPPPLTPVRRLHLAAGPQEGPDGLETAALPTALLLTPGDGGAAGVETRWHLAERPGWAVNGWPAWRLERRRARTAPPAAWQLTIGLQGPSLTSTPLEDAPGQTQPAARRATRAAPLPRFTPKSDIPPR